MMKRLLFFAALIVAIGSIGGNMLTAHAQTTPAATTTTTSSSLTPAQIGAIKQQLQVAQAALINLEMQNGIAASADAGTPSATPTPALTATTGLSATQISAFKTTLSTLAVTLSQLDASVVSNSALTPTQATAVQATLNGMQGTLVAMATDIVGASNKPLVNNTPVAVAKPASKSVAVNNMPASVATAQATPAGSAPIATQTSTTAPMATPAAPAVTAEASPSANNIAPQTAQASSIWSFTKAHWPTIVIVLLVIAILAILFWPEKKEPVRTVSTNATGSGKPLSAPVPTAVNFSHETTSAPAKLVESNNVPTPATPVANAVAAPSQK